MNQVTGLDQVPGVIPEGSAGGGACFAVKPRGGGRPAVLTRLPVTRSTRARARPAIFTTTGGVTRLHAGARDDARAHTGHLGRNNQGQPEAGREAPPAVRRTPVEGMSPAFQGAWHEQDATRIFD